jgi:glutamyl-tRNA reductase
LIVLSRHLERAAEIARPVDGTAAGIDLLSDSLRQADVAIACTSAPRFLLDPGNVRPRQKPLFIIDLGVPRNVDPAVAAIEGVTLHHLDQLVCDDAPTGEIIRAAVGIVQEEFRRFSRWLEGRRAARIVARLARQAEGRDPPAARAIRRRPHTSIMRLKEGTAA